MKHALIILLASAAVAAAQTTVTVGSVQHTNGRLVSPTNFWTANSNALNAVVAGGGGATTNASLLTAGTLADARLSTNVVLRTNVTQAVNAGGLLAGSANALWDSASGREGVRVEFGSPVFGGTNDHANWRSQLRLGWSGLTNTNATGFRAALGLGTNDAVRFGELSTENFSFILNELSYLGEPKMTFNPGVIEMRVPFSFTGPDSAANRGATVTNLGLTNIVRTGTNGVATAPAWYLSAAPTNGVATIATNQVGMGWDSLGRFTVQTPVMALSFYATGDPSSPTIYIPGTVVVNRLSSVFLDTQVYASNIVGGVSGGVLADSIMRASMPSVLRNFMGGDTAAGQAGVPYILTNASMQPVPGNYFPYARVITNASSVLELEGQWLNNTNMRAAIGAEIAATNVTVTNAVTLPAARRVIATIDSGLAGSSNTITLQTNAATHGDYAEVRYVRTADNATVNVVDPFVPATNAVMSTRSMFWSYSTNVSPARWVPVGRTIGADVVLGTLATNNSLPTGGAPTNALVVADGAGFATTRTNLPSLALTPGAVLTNSAPSLLLSQTWSNSAVTFTGMDINITNLASSNQFGTLISVLADFKTNNTRVASLDVNGTFYANVVGVPSALEMYLPSANRGGIRRFGTLSLWFAPATVAINTTAHADGLGLGPGAAPDVFVTREAAGSLAVRAAVATTNNVYGGWTNSTNYRRLSMGHNGTNAFIRVESAGPLTNSNTLIITGTWPTNTNGLSPGTLWNSNGILCVAP